MIGDEDGPTSVVTSSNLRRATQTAVVALWDRLQPDPSTGRFHEEIKILSSLQEVSRNVDTLSLAGNGAAVPLQGVAHALKINVIYRVGVAIFYIRVLLFFNVCTQQSVLFNFRFLATMSIFFFFHCIALSTSM
jgi:hypothetical protein